MKAVVSALVAGGIAFHAVGLAPAVQMSAPTDLNVRIVATANFNGSVTALIEDSNTQTESFYRPGDQVYGYTIVRIDSTGLTLTKAGDTYLVPFSPAVIRTREGDSVPEVVYASQYLPLTSQVAGVQRNFYTEESAPKGTQWDLWSPEKKTAAPRPTSVVADVGGRFGMPLRTYKKLTSKFGYRKHPIGGGTRMHNGIDLSAQPGTKIYAADAGTVEFAGWKGGYGYLIILDHHNGYRTYYAHCRKLVADAGTNVRRGEFIGEVGSTGASTGPHLHFEIRKGKTPVDPLRYLKGLN